MLFGIGTHPGSIHPAGIHPTETFHPSESKGRGGSDKPSSPVVTSWHEPFSSAASSGLPSSSRPMKSGMRDVTLPNDSRRYALKGAPDEHGFQEFIQRDPATDAPIPTGKFARLDGHGGIEFRDSQGAKPDAPRNVSTPTLPPPADIDATQLGPLTKDGYYRGNDGKPYGQSTEGYHPLSYDEQILEWRALHPDRPHDFTKSRPVELKGDGSIEPLAKPELKGGGFPKPYHEQLSEAQADVTQAESRLHAAQSRWQDAFRQHEAAERQHDTAKRDFDQAEGELARLERQHDQLEARLRIEGDPVRREDINGELAHNRGQLISARDRFRAAESGLSSADQAYGAADRRLNEAHAPLASLTETVMQAQLRLAMLRSNPPPF